MFAIEPYVSRAPMGNRNGFLERTYVKVWLFVHKRIFQSPFFSAGVDYILLTGVFNFWGVPWCHWQFMVAHESLSRISFVSLCMVDSETQLHFYRNKFVRWEYLCFLYFHVADALNNNLMARSTTLSRSRISKYLQRL